MKMTITIEVNLSQTIADTIKRTGFSIEPDGSGMKIVVPNAPTIPKRKVTVTYDQKVEHNK